jgi:hypothetical protein
MSEQFVLPPAVVIALWLNAARISAVSATDAANAVEVITEQVSMLSESSDGTVATSTWQALVAAAVQQPVPVAVALPVDGDPAGIPSQVLSQIDRDFGVVAISNNELLVRQITGTWVMIHSPNKVVHHDLNQTRRILLEQIELATKQLSASELTGEQSHVRSALEAFRNLHLPPHLSKRSTDALEMAARVLIVAKGAIPDSIAIHSPSVDRQRVQVLQSLITESRAVLQSVVAF